MTLAPAYRRSQPGGSVAKWWSGLSEEPYTAEEREVAQAIVRYLQNHPEAKDTVSGIAQWWLQREWSERSLREVERAVSFLRSQGLIIERHRKGMPPYYQLNPDKEGRDG